MRPDAVSLCRSLLSGKTRSAMLCWVRLRMAKGRNLVIDDAVCGAGPSACRCREASLGSDSLDDRLVSGSDADMCKEGIGGRDGVSLT